jgi:hypothetical protein
MGLGRRANGSRADLASVPTTGTYSESATDVTSISASKAA